MVLLPIQKEILEEIGKLGEREQHQVLDFARTLVRTKHRGTSGKELLRLAVGIEADDLRRMSDAIEEACEQVNPGER